MPEIKPFRGILYNNRKIRIADVVAPPYDVISPELQDELYERSPFNIVRIILAKEEDRYSRAAASFLRWKRKAVLINDSTPNIYVLSQSFTLPDGRQFTRRGFTVACRLEEFDRGLILPHEKTHSLPKEDRFRLFQATDTMFSQIFALYSDSGGVLERFLSPSAEPDIDVTFDHVQNTLWRLNDPLASGAIAEFMQSQKILIADGHHRYETALRYSNAKRLNNPGHTGKEPYNFVPMHLSNMEDRGILILPIHRLVHSLPTFDQATFLEELKKYFHVRTKTSAAELLLVLRAQTESCFGLVLSGRPSFVLLELKDKAMVRDRSKPNVYSDLDVVVLHSLILKTILRISEKAQEEKLYIDYVKDAEQAIRSVSNGKAQLAFLMNPTKIHQLGAVARVGMMMPQKSTYFYPKLLSGLVNYSFVEE